MKLTNKLGLPDALVNAVANDDYSRGEADISVTTLIGPVQIRRLLEAHGDELTEDVSERIWSLFGQSVHTVLERAQSSAMQEKRLYATIGDKVLSGKFDHLVLDGGLLSDYKVASVWSVIYGKPEWSLQLNVLAELCERNGYPIGALQIVALLRDWQKSKGGINGYPAHNVAIVKIPLWPQPERAFYIEDRMAAHFTDTVVSCTDEERWYQDGTWAVMQKGRKSALRVLDTKEEAQAWMAANKGDSIQKRTGVYRRCAEYCPVRDVCPQWALTQQQTNE